MMTKRKKQKHHAMISNMVPKRSGGRQESLANENLDIILARIDSLVEAAPIIKAFHGFYAMRSL